MLCDKIAAKDVRDAAGVCRGVVDFEWVARLCFVEVLSVADQALSDVVAMAFLKGCNFCMGQRVGRVVYEIGASCGKVRVAGGRRLAELRGRLPIHGLVVSC